MNARSSFADAAAAALTRNNLCSYPPRERRKLEAAAANPPPSQSAQLISSSLEEPLTYLTSNQPHSSVRPVQPIRAAASVELKVVGSNRPFLCKASNAERAKRALAQYHRLNQALKEGRLEEQLAIEHGD
jgi:hypothetical protein